MLFHLLLISSIIVPLVNCEVDSEGSTEPAICVTGLSPGLNPCYCELIINEDNFPSLNVDCSFINITVLESNGVELPENVEELDFSVNNLVTISKNNVLVSNSLQKLHLNANFIKSIEVGSFRGLTNLNHLDLSENWLTDLEFGVFDGLETLECLDLAANKLQNIGDFTFQKMHFLQMLVLDDNFISKYIENGMLFNEEHLAVNKDLEILSIEAVGLKELTDDMFQGTYNLRELKLSRNPIKILAELPYTLERLDLSDTLIPEIISNQFVNLPALQELKLNNLPYLTEIYNNTFSPLKGLQRLQLESCTSLRQFSPLAFGKDVLEGRSDFALLELSLRASRLTTLDESLAELFGKLAELDLQGNPWTCDCNLIWVKSLQIAPDAYDHIRCNKPYSLNNERLFQVDDEEFKCSEVYARLRGVANVVIILMCLGLVCLSVWLFMVYPKHHKRTHILQNSFVPSSPYARITIEPNAAEDYR